MKFIIESSVVPIYDRIASAFASALIDFGHTVYFINAADFTDVDFVNTINGIDIDYYLSTNELNKIHKRSDLFSCFLFEKIEKNIIFIHHDNLLSAFHDIEYIHNKLLALASIANTSTHFCLEKSNIETLAAYGISSGFHIFHASEFKVNHENTSLEYGVTFIGHLMSSIKGYPSESLPAGLHLEAMAWNRLSRSSFEIQPQIKCLMENQSFMDSLGPAARLSKLATQHFLVAGLNKFSSAMRGQLISTIKQHRVDIFGGDLSYGRIKDKLLKIDQSNIYYQPATTNYQNASKIYKSSRININISSLQFDSAVNNRVIDVVFAGGFILTDKRNDLHEICRVANEISFETPEEMNEKIAYYSDIGNNQKYLDIKHEVYENFKLNLNYEKLIQNIILNLKP